MPAIDSLLKILVARDAQALTVASGEVPVLRRGGEDQSLSMPPLDVSLVRLFVTEVVPEVRQGALEGGGVVDVQYRSEAGAFAAQVKRHGEGFSLTFQPSAAPPRAPALAVAAAPAASVAAHPAAPPAGPARALPAPTSVALASADLEPLFELLRHADDEDASDVIVSTSDDARLRVCGELVEIPHSRASQEQLLALFADLLDDAGRAGLERHGSIDGTLDLSAEGGRRYRVNLFRQQRGLAAALRPIRTAIPTLRDLSLPDELYELTSYPSGLVLITGQAGSGKSTTLAALTEHVNRTRAKHVITLEDPIEYQYASRRSLIHQREVGAHVESFSAGLRAAVRETPDIILLGEMRDLDTISAALTAAETGHLVLSTLHCGGAVVAVDRIIDVFPPHQQMQVRSQVASVLRAVVTQVLLPTTTPPRRVPALETMIVNNAIAAMIREGKSHQIASQIQTNRSAGMIPLERSLANLLRARQITLESARAAAQDPDALRALVG